MSVKWVRGEVECQRSCRSTLLLGGILRGKNAKSGQLWVVVMERRGAQQAVFGNPGYQGKIREKDERDFGGDLWDKVQTQRVLTEQSRHFKKAFWKRGSNHFYYTYSPRVNKRGISHRQQFIIFPQWSENCKISNLSTALTLPGGP